MDTKAVADQLVAACRANDWERPYAEVYSPDIVSIESGGPMKECRGMDQVRQKGEWFNSTFEVLDPKVEGPFVNGDQFACLFSMSTKNRETGETTTMSEIALYELKDGKIVREMFFH